MRSRSSNRSFAYSTNRAQSRSGRRAHGSIMPFLAVFSILMFGTVGICIDLMRDFETVHQLEFAAQTMACYALSQSTAQDGSYSINNAETNIFNAVINANTFNWNYAQCGPLGSSFKSAVWTKPVTINQGDVQFVPNPLDANEFLLELTARRTGQDALQQLFSPILWTNLSGPAPQSLRTLSTHYTVEVVGQPATRIGPAAPLNSQQGTRAAQQVGFATFPFAIGYPEFAAFSSGAQITQTIDLVSSTSKGNANDLKGCFVNIAPAANGNSYYGASQGNRAINQLEGLLNYFGANSQQPMLLPAAVEAGSQVGAFDPADPRFSARLIEVANALAPIAKTGRYYIVPVLQFDPQFGAINQVVGFARLQLTFNIAKGSLNSVTARLGDANDPVGSVTMPNASSATGYLTTSPTPGINPMPEPLALFTPRSWDPGTNGVSLRPRGIVLAPALSPRIFHAT